MNQQHDKWLGEPGPVHRSEVSIWLDRYEELFSDFDPRPYRERSLSDDFIDEARKVAREKKGAVTLKLLLPGPVRDQEIEGVIAQRLNEYFQNVSDRLTEERRTMWRNGLIMTLAGVGLMISASFIAFSTPEDYPLYLLQTLFEPSGWFLLWMGLEQLVSSYRKTGNDLKFYSKMSKAEIAFATIG